MPSQLGLTRTTGEGHACGGGGGPSRGADADADDDDDNAPVRRVSACGDLYSKDDLTDGMRGKLADVHASFKRPSQDPCKVQLYDPDRARKTLGMTRGTGSRPPPAPLPGAVGGPGVPVAPPAAAEDYKFEPLCLWEPPPLEDDADDEEDDAGAEEGGAAAEAEGEEGGEDAAALSKPKKKAKTGPPSIMVDGFICRFLRPHQREGTQFLFDCTMGQREFDGCGCILADDMGLGKVNPAVASRATRPLLPYHARSHARATTKRPAGPFALARRRRRCSRSAFCGR